MKLRETCVDTLSRRAIEDGEEEEEEKTSFARLRQREGSKEISKCCMRSRIEDVRGDAT